MITLILTVHLLLAAMYTVSLLGLTVAAAIRKKVPTIITSAMISFGSTVGTGILLVAVSPKAMAQLCTSTVIASAFGVGAWVLYKRRVPALQPEKSTLY